MNMLCNCITFFGILTVTKSFNSPENASILTTARFLQHIEYILGLTSSNNKSMNFFFREKKYMSSSRLRLPQVLWAKNGKK